MKNMLTRKYVVRWLAFGPILGASMGGLGCGTPPRPAALDQARTAYTQAQQNPQVAAQAPVALREAEQTLQRAEQIWKEDQNMKEVEHLAYITQQRVERARALAEKSTAEAAIQQSGMERERLLREARTREAQTAQQQAQQARQQAQVATSRAQQLEKELAAVQAKVRETDRGMVLTLGDVLFSSNQATLNPAAMRNLYPLVTLLQERPDRTVVIEGHTDSVGSESSNLDLSQRRAEAVRGFLIDNGITANRITARGYGEGSPVAPNDTDLGRQQNRRVEVVIAQ